MTYPSQNPSYTRRSKAKKRKSTGRKGLISAGRHDQAKKISTKGNELSRAINVVKAWRQGKPAFVTIANPNKKETNKRFIRVTAESFYGSHKAEYSMKTTGD